MGYAEISGLKTYKFSTTLKYSKSRDKTLLPHLCSLCRLHLSGEFHALFAGQFLTG